MRVALIQRSARLSFTVSAPKQSKASTQLFPNEGCQMGRAVVTKGHSGRRLGRTIRNLDASVELSSKESQAKEAEKRYKEKTTADEADSPVQKLRYPVNPRKDAVTP